MPKALKRSTLFFFVLPQIPLAGLALPLYIHLPPFYASHFGISLSAIGAIFMLARFWDVFTDPVFGLLADRWHTRIGVRRPWMLVALPILMASVAWIFFPRKGADEIYLGAGLFFLFIGWTIASISHHSWGAELSDDYDERSRIQGASQFTVIFGTIVVLLFPAMIEALPGTTPEMEIGSMGIFILLAVPVTFLLAIRYVPDHREAQEHFEVAGAWRAIAQNAALRRVLITDIAGGFGQGSVSGLFLFFAKDVLQLGDRANVLLLCFFCVGFLMAPLWIWLARHFQKHTTVCISAGYNVLAVGLLFFIPPGRLDLAAIVIALQGVNLASVPFLMRSCMADVADEDALRVGRHRTGLFFSMLTLTAKIGSAATIGINYVLLDMIGFNAQGGNEPTTIMALKVLFVSVPIVMSLVMIVAMARFPIGRAEQQILQEKLAARAKTKAAT